MKIFLPFLLTLLLLLNSCGIYKKTDARKIPTNSDERIAKNISDGKGFRLSNIGKKKSGGDFQFASSNPMWRASLEKLSFAPLSNVDYAGGIIVTDWFSEESSNEQIKITVRFLTNEIRSDGINIIIHKKICTSEGNCKINQVESILNNEIKFAILKKAAQIVNTDLKATKENTAPYKVPGKNY